jgi:murein DD-endopeptidase MepM/ murein hydrolase activator NlpD
MRLRFPSFPLAIVALAIVAGATGPVRADLIDDLKQQIAAKDAQVKELQNRAAEAKAQLSELRGKERTLANEISALDRQIESLTLDLQTTERRIEAADLRIRELELEITQHEEAIRLNEARISEILRTMQGEEDRIGTVALVFSGQPFSSIFDALRSSELLDASLAASLRDLKEAKADLEEARLSTEEERRQAEALRDELRVRQALLGAEQDERESLFIATKREEGNYQELLKNIQAQEQAIQREIRMLESQLRRAINPSSLPGKGVLSWPVSVVRITQGYGSTTSTGFINDQYDFHNGIDFGASTPGVIGDPILAAGSGTVIGVGSTGRYAYGKWIAIDHHNGLVTLYGHLSIQEVSVGQKVTAGQIIGRMGNTGFSTAPHLHFTVYASETFSIVSRWYGLLPIGASFNPLDFL